MADTGLGEEQLESRWEAAPAVVLVIASQVLLAGISRSQGWTLWDFPWWVWLIPVGPELILLIPLAWERPRHRLEQLGHRRTVALAQLGLISLANALLLVSVIASLVEGNEKSGAQLLLKALTLWGTNVITFGLWYWELDRGGPLASKEEGRAVLPDFLFPQMSDDRYAPPDWKPRFGDYLYFSLTNQTAFSPTDTMPLTARAKILMGIQGIAALVTVGIVVARAVNILGG